MSVLDALTLLPKSVTIPIASMVVGTGALLGLDHRYVTSDLFQKSYVLQLKSAIREVQKSIDEEPEPEIAEFLEEQLRSLIDELCYEAPEDPIYCDTDT